MRVDELGPRTEIVFVMVSREDVAEGVCTVGDERLAPDMADAG
jgi:hypothetical protein